MSERQPCKSCGELIQPDTAAKNDGLCMPCKRGERAKIEASKARRAQERLHEQSAERKHWLGLVARVSASPDGFERLTAAEQTYYAVTCLDREVHDGGFEQFFFNSSGDLYSQVLDGLLEMEAAESARQLVKAKQLLFGETPVPVDRAERCSCMRQEHARGELEELDRAFWAHAESLGARIQRFAVDRGLYHDA